MTQAVMQTAFTRSTATSTAPPAPFGKDCALRGRTPSGGPGISRTRSGKVRGLPGANLARGRSRRNDAVADGEPDHLHHRLEVELAQDGRAMRLHRLVADPEQRRDAVGAPSLRDELHDLAFARREQPEH